VISLAAPDNLDGFESFEKIIARLRAPDGCPWDREQTHTSLREYLMQETYEALAALDEKSPEKLCQELGDILLQIGLHARIAEESGEFTMADVIKGINAKLIRRHPHVFGDVEVKNAAEVEHNWEVIKQQEKGIDYSLLSSVPSQMPALSYSKEIQRRVAEAGFDWPDISGVIDKLAEEVGEFKESAGEQKSEEFGDVLFTLVNIARRMGIDSETALREANGKFFKRFTYMENLCRQRGLTFASLTFDQQNALWEEAKRGTGDMGKD
jgi:tetrapyrrole methylase family protein / MazG family protein